MAARVRRPALRWFAAACSIQMIVSDMLAWVNGGFSRDAPLCIAGHDRAGMERLLRNRSVGTPACRCEVG
jgi:hypothetical protein